MNSKEDLPREALFETSVETLVRSEDPARVVWSFVKDFDLAELGIVGRSGMPGRTGYCPRRLLALWLLGYWKKTRSTRQLEEACRSHISFIWLSNFQAPDHNTLWRFFDQHHEKFAKLFAASVKQAAEFNLVGGKVHALDGTKVAAAASSHRLWRKESLEKKLIKAQKEAGELTRQIKEAGSGELPQSMTSLVELVKTREEEIRAIKARLKILEDENARTLAPTDLEARHMKTTSGYRMAYNAQVVADEQHGILISSELTQSQTDHHELLPMLEMAAASLNGTTEALKESQPVTLADAGYYSNAGLAQAQEKGHEVLVNVDKGMKARRENPYDHSHFEYVKERDVLICPQGKELRLQQTVQNKGTPKKRYTCDQGARCPVAGLCTSSKKGRAVTLLQGHEATQRMRNKLTVQENAELLKKRSQIIERPFGEIKEIMGFRRFSVRGLKKSGAQWFLMITVFNLRRMKDQILDQSRHSNGPQNGAKNRCRKPNFVIRFATKRPNLLFQFAA